MNTSDNSQAMAPRTEDSLSDKTVSLKPSGIRKFFDIVSEMKDAISLGVGEPDFETPWHIRDEGIFSLEKGRTFYTSNSGLKELRVAIADYMKRSQGVDYDPIHEILITVGGSEAIDLMFRAMINAGDEVLIPQPSYVSYEPCAILADAKPVIINLKAENKFRLTPEELESACTEKSKILVLPFPNNPTGSIMTKEDLEALVPIIIKHNLYVLSDEIYGELTYTGKHVSIASLPGMRERTILVNGFSKAYAMTGWRLGYACGPAAIVRQMTKIHQYAIMCAPTTSQYAAVEALNNGDADVEMMRESYNERRRFVLNMLKEMGLPCFEPEGAFYVFPCIAEFGMSAEDFATKLLKEKKVAIVPGTAFGDCGEGYLRISYAYSIDNLRKALERLKDFVEELRKNK
jgi:aminotransferase